MTGNTIFNALSIGEATTDANDYPEDPPRILRTEILHNPFDDILPRQRSVGMNGGNESSRIADMNERKIK